ncbi:hypothetical protein QCA75_004775, partial [Salmonella enterica]|nr:hypothetical protein [Salmonella enterica]
MSRMSDLSKTNFAFRTETDRLLSGFRTGLSAKQTAHVNNFLLKNISDVSNSNVADSLPVSSALGMNQTQINRQRSASDSGIISRDLINVENRVSSPFGNISDEQVFTDFIHNPHKSEMARSLFYKLASLDLPDFVRNMPANEQGANLKSFLGILVSQKNNFTADEKKDFDRICREFLAAGNDLKKQERVYGMTRGLLSKYGRVALENHISYFTMFCIAAWEKYNGLNHQDVRGDDVFKKSINACKENLDNLILKLVESKDKSDVVIRLAATDFKNGVLAIPLTLKLFDEKQKNNKDETDETPLPLPTSTHRPSVEGVEDNKPFKLARKTEGGDVYLTLNIRDIGNNNGNNNGNNSPAGGGSGLEPYSFQLIKDLLDSGLSEDNKTNLIHHIL